MKKIAKTLIMGLLVLATCVSCGHDELPEESSTSVSVVTSVCTSALTTGSTTNTTTSTTTITTTKVTTETVLTSPVTTVTETVSEEVPTETEVPSEVIYEPVAEEYTPPVEVVSYLPIQECERILLCNLVAREYGSDYVPVAEKAKVVAVVMNRVNSPNFPNTIYEVLTQPDQFSGYLASDYYTSAVTDSVIESVDYYFNHTSEFSSSIFYFEGDGTWNYFS